MYIYIYIHIYIYIYTCKNTENPQICSFFFTDADKLGYLGSAGKANWNARFQQGVKGMGYSLMKQRLWNSKKHYVFF